MTDSNRMLIVGPSWVGDMVMAQSLYRLLRTRDSSLAIDVLAPAWSLPLLARMPEVVGGIELPVGHGQVGISVRRRIGHALRGQYARAIVLPRSLKSALVPWFARIPKRTGFRGEFRYGFINDIRPFDPKRLNQTVLRFIALGLAPDETGLPEPPAPALTVDAARQQALVAELGLDPGGSVVALMPGAEYGPAKQWPTGHFAGLAGQLAADGIEVWILGSAKEQALGERIAADANSDRVRNLCGRTTLVDAVDLLAAADVAVSNDSGLMHIAAAAGTKVVAIYGSSTPDFTPPLTTTASIHYRRLDCSPCFKRECPLGHLDCLTGISIEDVRASVQAAL